MKLPQAPQRVRRPSISVSRDARRPSLSTRFCHANGPDYWPFASAFTVQLTRCATGWSLLKYSSSNHPSKPPFLWRPVMWDYLMRALGLPNGGGWA
jgi:hypothetical protein